MLPINYIDLCIVSNFFSDIHVGKDMRTTCLNHFIGSYICTLYSSEEKQRLGLIELDDQLYVSFESCYLLVCFDKTYTTLHFPTYVGHTE